MAAIEIRRLGIGEREAGGKLFGMMAEVFGEVSRPLSDIYLDRLLADNGFWAMAATLDGEVVGGLTAHTLPMTTGEESEIFIYDLAVAGSHQREGIGRKLVSALLESAAAVGIQTAIVPADNDDRHALDFYRALGGEPSPVTLFLFKT